MSGLELALFGGFQARLDDQILVNFRSAKTQGLLIYLALTERRAHQRDALAGLLWPDEPEAVAKKNLRQSLYRLGGMLNDTSATPDPPYLVVNRTTVLLDPERRMSVDVDDYRAKVAEGALEAAVGCFRDELLPGFECGSETFDDWLRSEREDLRRSLLEALSTLAEERLFRGDHAGAAALARRQLHLEAWREEAHRQLMRSLVLSGDRGGAIAQFETCRRVLSNELDIEPAPATTQLVRKIRDNDLSQPARGYRGPEDNTETTHFVGRADALAALGGALQRSTTGRTQLAVVVGAAGAGKSALAERFLAAAAMQGADVLYARAVATRSGLPYQPLTSLLRRRIESENAPDDLLSDVWLSQLSRLLPELRDRYPDLNAPSQDQGSASHLLEAIARLGAALAQRQHTVLLIDDIHLADSASLDALAYAARRWNEQNLPMVVLITVRPETIFSAPLADWLDQLTRVMTTTRIDLQPLSALETHQLTDTLLGGRLPTDAVDGRSAEPAAWIRTVGDWLYARTGGHPLLVTATIKALVVSDLASAVGDEPGASPAELTLNEQTMTELVTPVLRSVVEPWLTRISPEGRAVLTAAAVLAEDASIDRLRTLVDLPEVEVADAVDELVGAQLLEEHAGAVESPAYRFSHELVGELVADIAGSARRRLLHRGALDALRRDGASAARLVRHALRAGSPNEAFELSVTAAQDAMQDLAAGVAVEHFSTARHIADGYGWPSTGTSTDRSTVLLGLARAFELTERWTEAEQTYRSALTRAREAGQSTIERRTLIRLAQTVYHSTDPERRASGTAMLRQARTLAADAGDRRGIAEVDLELASIAYHGGDLAGAERLLERAGGSDVLDRRLTARQRTLSCLVHISHRRWPEAAADAAAAAVLYDDDPILAHDARRSGAYCVLQSGRPNEALGMLEHTLAFSREIGNPWGETECLWKLGHTHLELGHYGQALGYAREGASRAEALGVPPLYELALAVLATVQRTLFDLPGARSTLLGELTTVREHMGASAVTEDWAASELCTISRLDGDWVRAADYAARRPGLRRDPSILTLGLSAWDAIDALLRSGDAVAAREEVEHLEAAATGNDRYQLVLRRSHAVLAAGSGDTDRAIAQLGDALHLSRSLGLPGEKWPILCALAHALKTSGGDDDVAEGMIRDAADIIDRLAATIEDDDVRRRFSNGAVVEAGLANTASPR